MRRLVCLLVFAVGCGSGSSGGGAAGNTPAPGGNTPPPTSFDLTAASAPGPGRIRLVFNAPVVEASVGAVTVAGLPVFGAGLDGSDPRVVLVDTWFQAAASVTVDLSGLRDAAGNPPATASVAVPGAGAAALEDTAASPPADLAALLARGWLVVDDPAAGNSAPSAWDVSQGLISQTSNIYGGSSGSTALPERAGTYLLYDGAGNLADAEIEATLRSTDDDGIGLLLRYVDPDHNYRFEWDRQRRRQRIVRVVGGVAEELAWDTTRYALGSSYRVRFAVFGERLAVWIDGELVLSAADSQLAAGHPGVYCWGNAGLEVEDVVVRTLPASLPAPAGVTRAARPDAPQLSHAPATADVGPRHAHLWARSGEDAEGRFELAVTPDFASPIATPVVSLTAAGDHILSARVDNLQPATRYYVRALLTEPGGTVASPSAVATFRTAPLPGTKPDVLFAFSADFHQGAPDRFAMLQFVENRQPDFFLNLGDFPYTDSSPAATTLEGYREKHRLVRSFDALEELFLAMPVCSIWDDHEIRNDWDGGTDPSRVALGVQVWKEYFPYEATPGAGGGIYRKFSWGDALEVFLLDNRYFRPDNAVPDNASKSMLGATQKQWLLNGLATSTATFKAIVSSVPLRYGTTGSDHWHGYQTERGELFDFLDQQGISGVFFLSGDQHWAAVHHHPEGYVEVQACPVSAGVRSPPSPLDPHVVFLAATQTFGVVRIDGGLSRCEIDIVDKHDQILHTEVILP